MKLKEKLIIKNFGPIVEAEIDIKPFMVFIGECGKSYISILFKKSKPVLDIKFKSPKNNIVLEKISFITDDRLTIPMLLNNSNMEITDKIPYHLKKLMMILPKLFLF